MPKLHRLPNPEWMLALLLAAAWVASPAQGQTAPAEASAPMTSATPSPTSARAVANALAVPEGPELDGVLDEPIWSSAPVINGFIEREPNEGSPAAEDTEVRLVFTQDALYIGARMRGRPEDIRADVTRRDATTDAEQLVISLDTYLDRRTAYTFVVTASGARIDYSHPSDSEGARDLSFDPVWEARTTLDAEGWTAEAWIPFTQLRFNPGDVQIWGVNFVRLRPALQNQSLWQLVRRDQTGWASRMGELRGIQGVRPSRRIELQPYVASSATLASGTVPENPFDDPRDVSFRAGGDAKMGLGPNFTLDLTVNPDFGQVEADPAVVNLSAFEVFFEERRPFFTEGARIFQAGGLVYTRRIGARPRGSPGGDYAEEMDATTILGAAKLTGRLASGLTLGVLGALTDEEEVSTFVEDSGTYGTSIVEPLTSYGVARVEQQFGPAGSTAALVVTGVHRRMAGLDDLAETLTENAASFGVDGRFRWVGGQYDLNWGLRVSHVSGSADAILLQQRSSRRYYQRPDADHVEVHEARTSLTGYTVSLGHSKTSGEHWLWDVDAWYETPGFEPNDIGQFGATDGIGGFAGLTYRDTTPGRFFRSYATRIMTDREYTFGGDRVSTWAGLNLSGTFTNFWFAELGIDYRPEVLSHTLTRGGPLMRQTGFRGAFTNIRGPGGGRVQWGLGGGWGETALGGGNYRISPNVSYRPSTRLSLSFAPEYRSETVAQQYVGTFDGGPEATFGDRYVFAHVERSELVARIRMSYAIGPDFTLETYLEPFASSGQYRNFGELVAAGGNDRRVYGEDGGTIVRGSNGRYTVADGGTFSFRDPDFHIRSFRSNVVMRWEWRRGSTLFLVWQQNRAGTGAAVEPAGFGDLWRGITADGDNHFAVKVTYWLPM